MTESFSLRNYNYYRIYVYAYSDITHKYIKFKCIFKYKNDYLKEILKMMSE